MLLEFASLDSLPQSYGWQSPREGLQCDWLILFYTCTTSLLSYCALCWITPWHCAGHPLCFTADPASVLVTMHILDKPIVGVGARHFRSQDLRTHSALSQLPCTLDWDSLSQQSCCLPVLQLGSNTIASYDHIRLLDVMLSSDLSDDWCFCWLRHLWHSWSSLDAESAATLVHAFVALCIDYCNAVLACAPKATTDKLQPVLNDAARVVTGTKKFEQGLSRLLRTELHWLDVPQRVTYKLSTMMFSCLHVQASRYLHNTCQPLSDVASRRHLRSAGRWLLNVAHQRQSAFA